MDIGYLITRLDWIQTIIQFSLSKFNVVLAANS